MLTEKAFHELTTNLCDDGQVSTFCLQEQPLLLEDLLEQEKREQEKQQGNPNVVAAVSVASSSSPLLSDAEFERIKADVFNSAANSVSSSPPRVMTGKILILNYF